MKKMMRLVMSAVTVAVLYGCGSGGSNGGGGYAGDSFVLPAGRAALAFSASSTARLDSSISGIDIAVVLPQGMSVATTGGGSSQIENGRVLAGSALTGTSLAYGNYSAPIRTAKLTMATTSNNYRSGEFLRLICTVDSNTSITVGSLRALNNPVTLIKAVGYDAATASTKVLTGKVKVTLDVAP
jgi:hypothetical protein